MDFRIFDRGEHMEIMGGDGVRIALYRYYRDPATGGEENHRSAIQKMRRAIRKHLASGGTLGNYQW